MIVTDKLSRPRLQAIIPTVPGREEWLEELLVSIRGQLEGASLSVLVSGNGTSELTEEIAVKFGCNFKLQRERISPELHMIEMYSYFEGEYIWIIGDDDHMAPGALRTVIGALDEAERSAQKLDALIGRVQYFSHADKSDLGIPKPEHWKPGYYNRLEDLGEATHGGNHLGAFVFSSQLFNVQDLEKYGGTQHNIFGAFWDGLKRARGSSTAVIPDVLLHMRQAEKEWDASRTAVRLGVKRLVRLLPPEIARHRVHYVNSKLTRRKALELASKASISDRETLQALVEEYETASVGSKWLARLHPGLASFLLRFTSWWMRKVDWVYSRLHR